MSEEILKALMQLFAIISKQDEGITDHQRRFVESFLMSQMNKEKVQEYLRLYDEMTARKFINRDHEEVHLFLGEPRDLSAKGEAP